MRLLIILFLFTGCATLNDTYERNRKNIHEFCENVEFAVKKKTSIAKSHCIVEATKTERIIDQENRKAWADLIYYSLVMIGLIILIF